MVKLLVCLVALSILSCSNAFINTSQRSPLVRTSRLVTAATTQIESANLVDDEAWRRYEFKKDRSIIRVNPKEQDEVSTMIKADVARGDTFWGGTFPRLKKQRIEARLNQDVEAGMAVEDNFIALMKSGWKRRLAAKQFLDNGGLLKSKGKVSPAMLPYTIAQQITDQFEVRRSSADQLEELQKSRVKDRGPLVRLLPRSWHIYVDYLISLKKGPTTGELIRNMAIAIVFALLSARARNVRFSFYFGIAGLIMNTSILVMRGAERFMGPRRPGYERAKVVTYSMASYKTALAISVLYGLAGLIPSFLLLKASPVKATTSNILRLCMPIAILVSGYFSSFYEVYEDKKNAGWRFKRVMRGSANDEISKRLKSKVFGDAEGGPFSEVYDYDYDPDIHDYPETPKYADQVQRHALKGEESEAPVKNAAASGTGFLDEEESTELFDKWYKERKDTRKDPIDEAEPDSPWVGGKKGMYPANVPEWLDSAYKKSNVKASKWKGKKSKYEREKDMAEEVVFYGPYAFRDKTPDWVQSLESEIWQEKVVASRSVARDYGTYRKSMFKIDKDVKLTKWDGVEDKGKRKDPEAKGKKPKEE